MYSSERANSVSVCGLRFADRVHQTGGTESGASDISSLSALCCMLRTCVKVYNGFTDPPANDKGRRST